jgi:hypothetical protein
MAQVSVHTRPDDAANSARGARAGDRHDGRHIPAGSFSPDGRQIALRLEDGGRYSLAVMDTNGRNVRKLFTGSVPPVTIDWGSGR